MDTVSCAAIARKDLRSVLHHAVPLFQLSDGDYATHVPTLMRPHSAAQTHACHAACATFARMRKRQSRKRFLKRGLLRKDALRAAFAWTRQFVLAEAGDERAA
jgi:hypothetical protein